MKKKLPGFSFYINIGNFEAFLWNLKLSVNLSFSGGPNRTGLTGFTGPVRYPVRFGPVRYFPQIPNRTFLMKCVPKWYLRLDFTFKSSKVAIFFGQISEISFQSHLIFIIQSFRNFEAGYIWKFICYEVRFGKVRFGSVKITGPVRFGKSGICLVRSTTAVVRVVVE